MKKSAIILFVVLGILFSFGVQVSAVPVLSIKKHYKQPEGVSFTGTPYGDEDGYYIVTEDGYVVLPNGENNCWCYAAILDCEAKELRASILQPSSLRYGIDPVPSLTLREDALGWFYYSETTAEEKARMDAWMQAEQERLQNPSTTSATEPQSYEDPGPDCFIYEEPESDYLIMESSNPSKEDEPEKITAQISSEADTIPSSMPADETDTETTVQMNSSPAAIEPISEKKKMKSPLVFILPGCGALLLAGGIFAIVRMQKKKKTK